MPNFSSRRTSSRARKLALDRLEDRFVFDVTPLPIPNPDPVPIPPLPGEPPLAVDDTATYQILIPSSPVSVLDNDLDGNPDATWDLSSLTVVSEPQHGILTLDSSTGLLLYTPNYLLPPGLPPETPPPPALEDSFTYHVKNSLGMQSNTASVTLFPIGSPKDGFIVSSPDIGFTQSMQPVVIDLLANDEIRHINRQIDPASVGFSEIAVFPGTRLPQHGTITFNPATGAATYTPNFGYVGWDSFSYQVSTNAGGPADDFPGEIFTSDDVVMVIIGMEPPRLQADPQGGKMLVVDGTNAADTIQIVPGDRWCEVKAIVNGVSSPSFRPTSRVLVFGYGGDDTITVDPRVGFRTWLIGGLGDDTLKAGGGSALLMGNEGDDKLTGGFNRDLLIGGDGMDSLFGSHSGDLLVGGTTRFDSQPAELNNAFNRWVWNSWYSYCYRSWWCGPPPRHRDVLKDTDVIDDAKKDLLNGGPGKDKVFATTTGVVDEVVNNRGHTPKRW